MSTKNRALKIRVTEEDLKIIEEKAQKRGMTKTELLVESVRKNNIIVVGRREFAECASELRKDGLKISQIKTLYNIGNLENDFIIELVESFNRLEASIRELLMTIREKNLEGADNEK